ncbi:MAG: hypothetical protein COB36_06140 [Alphaproteobacteria bacterium]|nr:MAG: hypothetical protein COB36_06140 [Alphaproteobacteria bacterium]
MNFNKSTYVRLAIVVIFILPSALFLLSLNRNYSEDIHRTERKIHGLAYNSALFDFIIYLQEFRGINNMHVAYISDDGSHMSVDDHSKHAVIENKITTVLGSLKSQKNIIAHLSDENVLDIGLQWDILSAEYDTVIKNALESSQENDFKKITSIIESAITLIDYVSITSGLVLDDSAQRHYITDLNINILPKVSELFARVRGLGVGYINHISQSKSTDGSFVWGLNQAYITMVQNDAAFNRSMQTIFLYNNNFKQKLLHAYRDTVHSDRAFDDAVENLIENNSSIDENEFFDIATEAIQGLIDVYHQSKEILDEDLRKFIDQTRSIQKIVNGFSGIAFTLILFVVANAMRDVRARKVAEEALSEERKFNEHIVAGTPGLISSVVPITGEIKFINPAFEHVSGYKKNELIGENYWEIFFTKEEGAVQRKKIDDATNFGKDKFEDYILPLRTKNGEIRMIVWSTIKAVAGVSEAEAVISMGRDITDERRESERERERQKMEALAGLAGGLAHEINNALVPIMGLSEMAIRQRDRGKDDNTTESLNIIHKNAMHARNIVRDILSFSRKDQCEETKHDIHDLLKDVILFSEDLLSSEIVLKYDNRIPNAHVSVLADRTGLIQIMTNLFTNAAYAMDDKGTIELTLDRIDLQGTLASELDVSSGAYAIITVVDEGCGIDDETMKSLFQPFFTTKPIGVGTGLGLSTVQGIINSWGGTMGVESTLGKSTTFILYIPIIETPKQSV